MRIGIYGGTFNPIHLGHMEAARCAAERLRLDKLCMIPTGVPPHKRLEDAPSSRDRLEMARLGAEAIGAPCEVEVLDLELRREGKSYTVDTLRELKRKLRGDRLFLLLGTDMFLSFQTWREPEEIAGMCTLCAFSREEAGGNGLLESQKRYLEQAMGADVKIVRLPQIIDISSTQLRGQLACGEGRAFLAPAVYGYILREGLYGTGADLKDLSLEDLRCVAMSMLRHRRIAHVLGTEGTAAALACRWGEDGQAARRAALLHDCTKKLDREQHMALCRQYGIALDPEERQEEKLLHAITGAAVAEHMFGESEAVVSAIRWHTTGRAAMTTLEKIIYLADYIEPTRDFGGLTELRALAFQDLDRAVLLGLKMAVHDLKKRGVAVHSNSVRARDYLKGKLT
mgnify:CR=1 FL=1